MAKPVGHTTDFTKAQETDLHKLASIVVLNSHTQCSIDTQMTP